MALQLGEVAPDFEAETTQGRIKFHDWIGDSWAVLFSHPKDFTPVCTTELGYMAKLKPEFDKRNTKIIGLSVDPVDKHSKWSDDIKDTQGYAPNYPMIGDPDLGACSPGVHDTRADGARQHRPNARLIGLASQPTSDLIADAPQRRQQLFLNGVKEAIDRRRLAPKIAATSGGTGVIQTS